jgi:glycosyltransferase involved in cell wall biosynthesis
MDQANYHLAWYLAERLDREVHLVTHRVAEPLATHPRVRLHLVPRPLGRHTLGGPMLDAAGCRVAHGLRSADPRTRVVVNGSNCRWPGVNWVHMLHAACPPARGEAPLVTRSCDALRRFFRLRRERRVLCRSPLLLANSERTRRDIVGQLGLAPERVKTVYLGVDPRRFGPVTAEERASARDGLGVDEAGTVIVFIGALGCDGNKGFDALLGACARLKDGCAATPGRVIVLAAGSGALRYWTVCAEARGLGREVRLLGHVADVVTLMASADILVSPTRYDGYGLAVHETLCRGIPAVVSKCAGVAERYPQELADLLLNDPDDCGELTACLGRWQQRKPQYRPALDRLAAELRSRTWDDMAEEIIGLVEENRGSARAAGDAGSERAGSARPAGN